MTSFNVSLLNGLCNRLRSLYSHYNYCLAKNLNMNIYNIPTHYCIEDFSYYLVFPNNISFIHERSDNKELQNVVASGGFVGGSVSSPHSNNKSDHAYDGHKNNIYSELKFSEEITSKVINEKYIAVHVRRTDICRLSNTYPMLSDSYYMDFIDSHDSNLKIYIATDNKETSDIFKKKYGSRIISNNSFDKKFGIRNTSVRDTIIDIFMCMQSTFFLGTRLSSMTDLIYQYRYFVLKNNNASELKTATSITYRSLHVDENENPPIR
uniref:GT23 domain-containing protein n=1 Tax=viral metagenome TaxID=1070528 RepID=A0A6C0AWH9_9ZZZZ